MEIKYNENRVCEILKQQNKDKKIKTLLKEWLYSSSKMDIDYIKTELSKKINRNKDFSENDYRIISKKTGVSVNYLKGLTYIPDPSRDNLDIEFESFKDYLKTLGFELSPHIYFAADKFDEHCAIDVFFYGQKDTDVTESESLPPAINYIGTATKNRFNSIKKFLETSIYPFSSKIDKLSAEEKGFSDYSFVVQIKKELNPKYDIEILYDDNNPLKNAPTPEKYIEERNMENNRKEFIIETYNKIIKNESVPITHLNSALTYYFDCLYILPLFDLYEMKNKGKRIKKEFNRHFYTGEILDLMEKFKKFSKSNFEILIN